ncbi:MAG: phenylalanine--tRNA ligase subunit beta, partial [Burkholderiales bacterium]|nr:phenylalanine--tRNA ligase subunit beta [Burkholderiales bacterium]
QKYDLPLAPVVFEVDVASLQNVVVPVYQETSKFQAVSRDLALVVKQTVAAQELQDIFAAELLQNEACKIVQAIVLFDEYRGKGLESDEKSLAFRFSLQDTQSTLQDDKIDAAMAALILAANNKIGARLR